jgi:CSLREA domain-containing protein
MKDGNARACTTARRAHEGKAMKTKTLLILASGLLLLAFAGCGNQSTGIEPDGALLTRLSSGPIVNSLADPGDGTCDETECTLREAIAAAEDGATITFDVTGTIVLTEEVELVIARDLVIAGPGASRLSVSGNDTDRYNRVLRIDYGATVSISGLTITGGAPGPSRGGGIWNAGTLTLTECTVSGNRAMYGGGIYNTAVVAYVIHDDAGILTLMNTTVSGNGPNGEDPVGGGILNDSGTVTLTGSTVSRNSSDQGAGIASWAGTLAVTRSTISSNTGRHGGGLYLIGTTATITESTISENWSHFGGGVWNWNSSLMLERSTISGNRSGRGGGVFSRTEPDASAQNTTILNSTVSGNTSGFPDEEDDFFGGGIYNELGLTRIVLSTVTGNQAGASGGGVYSAGGTYDAAVATTEVKGSLIWGNTIGTGTADDVATFDTTQNRFLSLGHNLVGAAGDLAGAFAGNGDQTGVADVLLGPLASNGGPTDTHALLAGSPAIGTGTCADQDGRTVASDQRGVSRPQGSACDIGAYELEQAAPVFTSSCTYMINLRNGQRTVNVTWANAEPGATRIEVADGKVVIKQMAPTESGSWTTNVKEDPTYGIWGGTNRKDASQVLVPARTVCAP